MMQRLVDQASSQDPATARAASLLRSMPPLDGDRLRRRPLPPIDQRSMAVRLRGAIFTAATLASVAAAAATTAHHAGWLHLTSNVTVVDPPNAPAPSRALGRGGPSDHDIAPTPPPGTPATEAASPSTPLEAPVQDPSRTAPASAPTSPTSPLQQASPSSLAAPASPSVPSVPSVPGARPVAPRAATVSSSPSAGPRAAAASAPAAGRTPPADDESALMVDSVKALRRDDNPARAQALAEETLRRYPHGVQAEEAMALAMEAASARGDTAGARRSAQRYLDNFRSGRFADRAQHILASLPR